jgi:hypothetical protein
MIARALFNAVTAHSTYLRSRGVRVPERALTVGFGNIGGAMARLLGPARADVFDISGKVRRIARKDFVVPRSLEAGLGHHSLILPATGRIAIDERALHHVPDGAILFNLGSADTEYGFDKLALSADPEGWRAGRQTFGGAVLEADPARGQLDRVLKTRRGKALLTLDGGVIFTPESAIPPRYSQLIRGLLLLGVLQAVKTTEPGVHTLEAGPHSPQARFVASIQRELAETGESLENPVF